MEKLYNWTETENQNLYNRNILWLKQIYLHIYFHNLLIMAKYLFLSISLIKMNIFILWQIETVFFLNSKI